MGKDQNGSSRLEPFLFAEPNAVNGFGKSQYDRSNRMSRFCEACATTHPVRISRHLSPDCWQLAYCAVQSALTKTSRPLGEHENLDRGRPAWSASLLSLRPQQPSLAPSLLSANANRVIDIKVKAVAIPSDAAAIERGRYLYASRGCADCHGANGAGRAFIDNGDMPLPAPISARGRAMSWPATSRKTGYARYATV